MALLPLLNKLFPNAPANAPAAPPLALAADAGRAPRPGARVRLLLLPALLPALLLAGCGHDLPTQVPGFNANSWRRDPYACLGRRAAQLPALLKVRSQLYGARAGAVDKLLGHPDEEELRAQTEKVYYYYLAPGTQCRPAHQRSAAPKLSLRFGPLGTVTEILVDPLPRP